MSGPFGGSSPTDRVTAGSEPVLAFPSRPGRTFALSDTVDMASWIAHGAAATTACVPRGGKPRSHPRRLDRPQSTPAIALDARIRSDEAHPRGGGRRRRAAPHSRRAQVSAPTRPRRSATTPSPESQLARSHSSLHHARADESYATLAIAGRSHLPCGPMNRPDVRASVLGGADINDGTSANGIPQACRRAGPEWRRLGPLTFGGRFAAEAAAPDGLGVS